MHSRGVAGSDAPILAYMDVDLSTDLDALAARRAADVGHSDLAIGSRLHRDARVVRGTKRELIPRCYNLLLHGALGARFSDAQCGQAIRKDVAAKPLPPSTTRPWFFDTELLVLAERCGLRIHEVPVGWYGTPTRGWTSPAPPWTTCAGSGACDGRWPPAPCPWRRSRAASAVAARAAGSADTVGSAASSHGLRAGRGQHGVHARAFTLLRPALESAQTANLLALLVAAVANTAMNRRWTFGLRGREQATRQHLWDWGSSP